MQQSNAYIVGFAAVTTIILGAILSLAAVSLKPAQDIAKDKDTKSQILGAVSKLGKEDDVLGIYAKKIESYVVDYNGDIKETNEAGEPLIAEKINILKEFKKDKTERAYPVFKYLTENGDLEAIIVPAFGNGLWNNIWGYVALAPDLSSIIGVSFDHVGETPGLGARITDPEVQARYKGKKVYDEAGELVSVTMLKRERGNTLTDFSVDGLSGATKTAEGVNEMIKNYLMHYENHFKKAGLGSKTKKEEPMIEEEIQAADSTIAGTDTLQVITDDSPAVEPVKE